MASAHSFRGVADAPLVRNGCEQASRVVVDRTREQLIGRPLFDNPAEERALLVARLDNLGKGASGAACQNIDLMLGLDGTGHTYTL